MANNGAKVLDMLSETRTELDEFHQASKELEAELESELQRTEKSQHELRNKVVRAENERDEWKVRTLLVTSNAPQLNIGFSRNS